MGRKLCLILGHHPQPGDHPDHGETQQAPLILCVYKQGEYKQLKQRENGVCPPFPSSFGLCTAPRPARDSLSERQLRVGADCALFRPPSLEAGLQPARGGCLAQLGGALASWGGPSPCSRHPFTSSTGMSAADVRMEGGQLLAWPFWAKEVLGELPARGWGELWPKASLG